MEKKAKRLEKAIKKLDEEVTLQYENLGNAELIATIEKDKIISIIVCMNQQIEEYNSKLVKLQKQIKAVKENTLNYQKIAFML